MTHRAEHEEHLKWAYLDGEMSASEAADFADARSPEERRELLDEVLFEDALSERLSEPVACSSDAWRLALSRVNEAAASSRDSDVRRLSFGQRILRHPRVLVAAAACVFVMAGTLLFVAKTTEPSAILSLGDRGGSLAARSGDERPSVRAFLEQRRLAFDPSNTLGQKTSHYKVLGAREDRFGKEKFVQVFFDCDGEPAKLVIAPRSGGAAEEIGRGVARGSVRVSYPVGDVLVAVVGGESASGLLGIVASPGTEPATLTEERPEAEVSDGKHSKSPAKAPELTDVVPESGGATVAPAVPVAPVAPEASGGSAKPDKAGMPESSGHSSSNDERPSPRNERPSPHDDKSESSNSSTDSGLTLI